MVKLVTACSLTRAWLQRSSCYFVVGRFQVCENGVTRISIQLCPQSRVIYTQPVHVRMLFRVFCFVVVESMASCSLKQFACNISSGFPPACIPSKYLCDGYIDCYNGDDEWPKQVGLPISRRPISNSAK
jgi:hypothetical protein